MMALQAECQIKPALPTQGLRGIQTAGRYDNAKAKTALKRGTNES